MCGFMHACFPYSYIYLYRYVVVFVSFVSEKVLYTHGKIAHAIAAGLKSTYPRPRKRPLDLEQ